MTVHFRDPSQGRLGLYKFAGLDKRLDQYRFIFDFIPKFLKLQLTSFEFLTIHMEYANVFYAVPVIVSKFEGWSHPDTAKLYAYSEESCDHSLREVSENEVVSHNGSFAACGGLYCGWIYPSGNMDRIKIVADFYSAWAFVDDLIDNSTDMTYVSDLLETVKARVAGSPQGPQGLDFMHRLFTHEGWHPEALRLIKQEMDLWRYCTIALRKIEAEKRIVSVDEYLVYRRTNTAMGIMHLVLSFTNPELTDEFLKFNEFASDTMHCVFSYCGITIAMVLDLYKLNADHAQICEYSNIAKIIQNNSRPLMSLPEAVGRSIDVFHEYEEKLGVELEQVAAFSPMLAKAIENVHTGSIIWLEVLRGRRYAKKADA
jgi:hypothetical protein